MMKVENSACEVNTMKIGPVDMEPGRVIMNHIPEAMGLGLVDTEPGQVVTGLGLVVMGLGRAVTVLGQVVMALGRGMMAPGLAHSRTRELQECLHLIPRYSLGLVIGLNLTVEH